MDRELRLLLWEQEAIKIDFGHWILRAIAYVIDSVIIGIVTCIIFSVVLYLVIYSDAFYWLYFEFGYYLMFPFIFGILEALYFAILDVAWGETIGKRIMGPQVQMPNGNKVPFDKALIRKIKQNPLDFSIAILGYRPFHARS